MYLFFPELNNNCYQSSILILSSKVQEECLDSCEKTLIWILKRNSAVAGRMWPWWLPLQSRKLQLVKSQPKHPHIRELCPNVPGHWCEMTAGGCNILRFLSAGGQRAHMRRLQNSGRCWSVFISHKMESTIARGRWIEVHPLLIRSLTSFWCQHETSTHDDELKYLQVCLRNTLHTSRFPACSMNNPNVHRSRAQGPRASSSTEECKHAGATQTPGLLVVEQQHGF